MIEIEEEDFDVNILNPEGPGLFDWNVGDAEAETERFKGQYSVIRHKIASSPIVQALYKLRYSINKSHVGLENENREGDGSILTAKMWREIKPTKDSYDLEIDSFDELEDEMLHYTRAEVNDQPIEVERDTDLVHELVEILVTVQQSSIRINNEATFELPSYIRSSNILRGAELGNGNIDEDSLLITLSSGFLLLIKFFTSDSTVKPYVVQWWKTSQNEREPPRSIDVGRQIHTHKSSSSVAVTALKDLVRLFYCVQTPHGIMLDRVQNLAFDGTILHSCFLEPVKEIEENKHVFFASLVVTSQRRYLIRLFEWWLDESRIVEHTPMLLTNDFEIPVNMLPFQNGLMMVMEKKLVVITVNQILSADYDFLTVEFPGSFPVSYFKPETPLFTNDAAREVVIASEDGTIYSTVYQESSLEVRPVLKISKITQFILDRSENGYDLLFASEFSNGGFLHFPYDTVKVGGSSFPTGQVVDSWENWAPIFDVEVVDKKDKSQELWIAHGRNLSKFCYGIYADKLINDFNLRKAYKVFSHFVEGSLYFIFSFFDKTLIFRYDDEELQDIPDSGLDLVVRTIHISSLESICFQVTENSIVIADFETGRVLRKDVDDEIIFADCFENFVCTIDEVYGIDEASITILNIYQAEGELSLYGGPIKVTERPNFAKFVRFERTLFIVLGFERGLTLYLMTSSGFVKHQNVSLSISEPHDLVAADNVLYVTSRYGEYAMYDMLGSLNEISIKERAIVKLTDSPLEAYLTDNYLLLTSKYIWKLELGTTNPIPIIFKEQKDRLIYSAISITQSQLALLRDDGFCIASLSVRTGPVLKTIKLREIPKRIKYLSHLSVFAILTDSSLIFASKTAKLDRRLYSKKKEEVFVDETPLSISQWIFPTSVKSFRNLLVGCGSRTGGSLKILRPKFSPEGDHIVEAYEIFSIKTDGPVLAAKQFSDCTIVYSNGKKLLSSDYDLELKKMKDPIEIFAFNSLIMNIDVKGNMLLVSSKDYCITTFRYEDGYFNMMNDDSILRKVTNSLLLEENVTVTTDKMHCCITGVQDQQNRFRTFVTFVPRLERCHFMPNWSQNKMLRFLAFGIGGDLQIFTLLDGEQTSRFKRYYKRFVGVPNIVTKKGLWEINEGPWSGERNSSTYDQDRFDYESCPYELTELLKNISI